MLDPVIADSALESNSALKSAIPPPPIVVLSDRALVRELIVEFLRRHGFPQAVGVAGSAVLQRVLTRDATGLVLVDLGHEWEDPSQVLRNLRKHRPHATSVAIGTPMELAAQAGEADGWIELSEPGSRVADIAAAVTSARKGPLKLSSSPCVERLSPTWQTLTRRQRQVLALLGCGVSNQRLAAVLGVSERAVKAHVSALLEKFKADSRTELALIACHAGLHAANAKFPFAGK